MDTRGPDSDKETLTYFAGAADEIRRPGREDIKGWMDLLDLDDYVTFGGKALIDRACQEIHPKNQKAKAPWKKPAPKKGQPHHVVARGQGEGESLGQEGRASVPEPGRQHESGEEEKGIREEGRISDGKITARYLCFCFTDKDISP